jgi:hypothetical protein
MPAQMPIAAGMSPASVDDAQIMSVVNEVLQLLKQKGEF